MFSFMGTPSAKNFITENVLFRVDLSDRVFLDLFLEVALVIIPSTLSHPEAR